MTFNVKDMLIGYDPGHGKDVSCLVIARPPSTPAGFVKVEKVFYDKEADEVYNKLMRKDETIMVHMLKISTEFFDSVAHGTKPFELRKDDRGFKTGDNVTLQEYDMDRKEYTGRQIYGIINYILRDYPGLQDGYCIFTLVEKEIWDHYETR